LNVSSSQIRGSVSGASLERLESTPDLVPNLKKLVLLNQLYFGTNAFRKLSRARPTLVIKNGETLGDGVAANVIATMTRGVPVKTWFGGEVINTHRDTGWYAPGKEDFPGSGYDFFGMGDESDDEDESESEDENDDDESEFEDENRDEDEDDGEDDNGL
jgi:hypothetical protein